LQSLTEASRQRREASRAVRVVAAGPGPFGPAGEPVRVQRGFPADLCDTALLEVAVVDSGIGVPAGKQSLLSETFSPVDGSTTHHCDGAGLGLSIVRHMATLMGGEVGVDSRAGDGARFWFCIRAALAAADEAGAASGSSLPRRWPAPSSQRRRLGCRIASESICQQ
jgi:signal transduction histidine kinase